MNPNVCNMSRGMHTGICISLYIIYLFTCHLFVYLRPTQHLEVVTVPKEVVVISLHLEVVSNHTLTTVCQIQGEQMKSWAEFLSGIQLWC